MENNYEQNNPQREPLPNYGYVPQAPVMEQNYQQNRAAEAYVKPIVDSAFGKGLAAAIMCEIPVASIIAIFMGNSAVSLVQQAEQMAAQYGISAGGKCTAAKVLGKVGKFAGIGFTIFYVLYFGFLFLYLLFIVMMGMQY